MRTLRGMKLGLTLAVVLGGCANTGLRELQSGSKGPDEFLVHPVKPLEQPADVSNLPLPTPGGANLADQNPLDDVAIALGGRAATSPTGPIPGADGTIVNYSRRFGVSADIRQTLATEDASFRKGRSRFTQYRVVKYDQYNRVYREFALDPFVVAEGYRRIGVKTPSAPPAN